MTGLRLPILLATSMGLSGCFLVGLSDDLGQKSCESDADCAGLEPEDGDACMAWQCRPDAERGADYCQYTPLDADNDGALAASVPGNDGGDTACETGDAPVDCDDGDDRRSPELTETCDGLDNDCDLGVDEGVLSVTPNTGVLFDGALRQVDFAVNTEAGTLAAVYAIEGGGLPGASLIALDTSEAAGEQRVSLDIEDVMAPTAVTRQVGVTTLDSSNFAVAYFDDSGDERLIAGILPRKDSSSDLNIDVDPDVYRWGLACAEGEACAANASMPEMTVEHPPTEQLSLAASGRRVMLSYLRQPAMSPPACGDRPAEGDEPTVMLSQLAKPATRGVLIDSVDHPIELGKAREVAAPAMLTLPDIDGVGGFLVAFTELGGDIVVHHVTDGPAATETPIRVQGDAVGRPAIAIGEVTRDAADDEDTGPASVVLTVAYQSGCEFDAAIEARMFTLTSDGTTLMAEELGGPLALSDENATRHPAVAYSSTHDLWGVTYRSPLGLHARLIEADGRIRGEASYVLVEAAPEEGEALSFALDPTIFPLDATNEIFGAASVARADSGRYSVELGRLDVCGQ